jgi:hypothetical protein
VGEGLDGRGTRLESRRRVTSVDDARDDDDDDDDDAIESVDRSG